MKCPACPIDLHRTERRGVEIDDCAQCCIVWLERGELDKLIEHSNGDRPPTAPVDRHANELRVLLEERWDEDEDERQRYRGRRRKSFLDELLDFG